MFDIRKHYFNATMGRDAEMNEEHPNEAMVQAYSTLINVISNDVRFRADNFIELSQATHNED